MVEKVFKHVAERIQIFIGVTKNVSEIITGTKNSFEVLPSKLCFKSY